MTRSTFAALASRNYRLYWLGLVCYVLGHRAEYVTFSWMVWEVSHDPLYLGYLGLAQGVPLVVFQLFGGVLADRVNRLRLLIGTQVLTAATLAAAFALSVTGRVSVEHLLALAALSSTFRAFDEPTRLSLIPQLVERDRLANAIALGSIPWQASRMIGPSVTGILIAAFGGTVGFGLAAGASVGALLLYSRLRLRAEPSQSARAHMMRQLVEGLSFVAHDFVFAALIGLALFNAVFGLSYVTLLPIFADVYFGTGSTGYGLLNAAHGIGMGLALMVFSMSPAMGMALSMLVVVGFANTFYLTQVSTFIQSNVPDRLRGRVLSIYALCWNLLPLGGLIGGALAAAVDARFAVAFGGAMVAINALVLLTSKRLRALGY